MITKNKRFILHQFSRFLHKRKSMFCFNVKILFHVADLEMVTSWHICNLKYLFHFCFVFRNSKQTPSEFFMFGYEKREKSWFPYFQKCYTHLPYFVCLWTVRPRAFLCFCLTFQAGSNFISLVVCVLKIQKKKKKKVPCRMVTTVFLLTNHTSHFFFISVCLYFKIVFAIKLFNSIDLN